MIIEDLEYYTRSANYKNKLSGIDNPNTVTILNARHSDYKKWWYNHATQNFDYRFNSWGFRGEEYDQYVGKAVNICLGDSFTVNVGGPIEHSWPSLLSKYFDIPTLNFGMDGCGNDAIKLVYDRATKIFDVQNVFVKYSFFHRRIQDRKFILCADTTEQENFDYFKLQRLPNAYECSLPWYSWSEKEELFLKQLGIFYLQKPQNMRYNNTKIPHNLREFYIDKQSYKDLQGEGWPSYEQFIKDKSEHDDMKSDQFGNFIDPKFSLISRDGVHLTKQANQIYADTLYKQWKQDES